MGLILLLLIVLIVRTVMKKKKSMHSKRKQIPYEKSIAGANQKRYEEFLNLLGNFEQETKVRKFQQLQNMKSRNKSLTRQLQITRNDNSKLTEKLEYERSIQTASKRQVFYRKQAKNLVDSQQKEIEKLKLARLQEEIRRLKLEKKTSE